MHVSPSRGIGDQQHPNGTTAMKTSPESPQRNAWSSPGPAAFDFRSDVVTTPTPSMLDAIRNCTLLDDVFTEDPTTISLESHISDLTGFPAALLVTSGTQGNQLSIRTHMTQPPHSILADSRSHIYQWEAGGICSLTGAFPIQVVPQNDHHLTLLDVKKHAVLDDDVHHCPTRLISLENTLNGSILPLSDCRAISRFARQHHIPLHLDGARLWEAVSAGEGSLQEYCACFDSVSLCFSKGLGAPVGSIVAGSREFIRRARHVRKAMGGGMRQSGVIAAPARVAVDETFLGGKLVRSHETARKVGGMWEAKGGHLAHGGRGVESNMVWLDLDAAGVPVQEFVEAGVREGVKVMGGRIVCHYQIGEEGVRALGRVMDVVLGKTKAKGKRQLDGEGDDEKVTKKAKEVLEVEME
ncbi:MAG: hypothetical protein LQ349_009824 [Xanthoria aureola]|nr:MAG: hypothetical protein LQ349_009824 [Xanthoria aureola]